MNRAQVLGKRATGVPEIDFEHGLQIGLIEAFQSAIAGGGGGEEPRRILERLMDFTNAHFLAEQLMMRLYNYPDYEGHVQEHDRLVDALKVIQDGLASGAPADGSGAVGRLHEWWVTHVQTQDQAFAAFLKERAPAGEGVPSSGAGPKAFPGVE